jgi:cell filamentation protein
MTKYSNHDHYVDQASGVLTNKLNIADAETLEKQEADYAAVRSYELSQNPIKGSFDLAHLKAIHKQLFGDLYSWAGELRDIDISKGDNFFAHHMHIESAAIPIFKQLAEELYLAGITPAEFSERAAYYLGEINALHPFREGNGRAQREFINHLAYKNGYRIDWGNITQQDMIQASIESFKGNCSKFADYIRANIISS